MHRGTVLLAAMRGTQAILAAIVLAACTSGPGPPDEQPTLSPDEEGLVRGCESAVFGDPNLKNALRVGPLALVGIHEAATLSAKAFHQRHGRYSAIKILAVVEGSDDVTVTLHPNWRENVALLYDPRARGNRHGFRFAAGDHRVTFQSCPQGEAQYNGGFLATRPDCVKLMIEPEGSEPRTGWISLGAGLSCPG